MLQRSTRACVVLSFLTESQILSSHLIVFGLQLLSFHNVSLHFWMGKQRLAKMHF